MARLRIEDLLNESRKRFVQALEEDDRIDLNFGPTFSLILQMAVQTCLIEREELSRLFGVHQSTISKWLSAQSLPGKSYRWMLVEKLEAKVRELIEEDVH